MVITSTSPLRSAAERVKGSGIGLKTMRWILGAPRQCLSNASTVRCSSFTSATNRNGPVPTGRRANAALPFSAVYFGGRIGKSISRFSSGAYDCFVTRLTVRSSTTSTRVISLMVARLGDFCSGSSTRCTVKRTASALNGSPSWKTTPRRSRSCHVVSSSSFHDSASSGTSLPEASRPTSESNMLAPTAARIDERFMVGSRFSGVHGIATRSSAFRSDGGSAAGVGVASARTAATTVSARRITTRRRGRRRRRRRDGCRARRAAARTPASR